MSVLRIVPVPLFSDNYAYLIANTTTGDCCAVDPAEPDKIEEAIQANGFKLTNILTTHSHWDHAGGNEEMKKLYPGVRVFGGSGDGASGVSEEVTADQHLSVAGGTLPLQVLYTPCHTSGHVSYYFPPHPQFNGAVFTGDTLFIAGCGNFNSGTPTQMYQALVKCLGSLPPDTEVYVGHEYTVNNLTFASLVEPSNEAISKKLAWATSRRAQGLPTIPSTIADEWATNPFMRVHEPTVAQFAQRQDPVDVIAEIRRLKTEWGRKK